MRAIEVKKTWHSNLDGHIYLDKSKNGYCQQEDSWAFCGTLKNWRDHNWEPDHIVSDNIIIVSQYSEANDAN